jgi:hypothetical protein
LQWQGYRREYSRANDHKSANRVGIAVFSSRQLSLKRRQQRLGANMYEVLILLVLANLGFTSYIWRTVRRGPKRKFLDKLLNAKPITPNHTPSSLGNGIELRITDEDRRFFSDFEMFADALNHRFEPNEPWRLQERPNAELTSREEPEYGRRYEIFRFLSLTQFVHHVLKAGAHPPLERATIRYTMGSFSLWRGSNDKLSSERDLRFYGIRDEALCFDAVHDFAGKFEFGFVFEAYARSNHNFCDAVLAFDIFEQAFGFTFISYRSQALRLGEREEGQHHACID